MRRASTPIPRPEEAETIKARIDRDRGDAVADSLHFSKVLHHLHDWKLWEWAWLYLGFSLPIILSGDMGYTTTMAQILSFPPYVAAALWMLSTAWFADRYRKRGATLISQRLRIHRRHRHDRLHPLQPSRKIRGRLPRRLRLQLQRPDAP